MAFFSKNPGGKKPSSAAGDLFRSKNGDKMGVGASGSQAFQKRMEAKVEKDLADYTKAKVNSARARGEKGDNIEISANVKKMLTILAHQKVQKEIKKEKKVAVALERAKKAQKNSEA